MPEPTKPDLAIKPGDRVEGRDASGVWRPAVVEHGPARDRAGIRGKFLKYWLIFDADRGPVPWPVEDVRRPAPGQDGSSADG